MEASPMERTRPDEVLIKEEGEEPREFSPSSSEVGGDDKDFDPEVMVVVDDDEEEEDWAPDKKRRRSGNAEAPQSAAETVWNGT